MFFIKSCLQCFKAMSLCRNKGEQKHRVPDTYYLNKDPTNVTKFVKVTSNLTQ